MVVVFFFKQKTAYEMRISDWSSDVCSSDLGGGSGLECGNEGGSATRNVRPGRRQPFGGEHKLGGKIGGFQAGAGGQGEDGFPNDRHAILDLGRKQEQIERASGRERVGQYV